MNEKDVIEIFRESRSEEAFAELARRYAGMVYAVAKRRSANGALAEDITQIVFIRLAKAFPKVRNPAELAAWLHRTTVNVTIDTWRSESRRRNREQQAAVMEPATPENDIWEEISPQLDEALNQLNDDDRQALLLRFFGQKTMRDVGLVMGVSEAAAKMRVNRAVERLRTQLGVRGAVCTGVVLATIMAERSVEAAPGKLMAQLAAIKLPATAAGIGGLFVALLRVSKWKLAAGAVAAGLILACVIHGVRSANTPVSGSVLTDSQTNLVKSMTIRARGKATGSSDLAEAEIPASKPLKMVFHVVDSKTGEALVNTRVHAAYFGPGGQGEAKEVISDDKGNAAIPEPDDAVRSRAMNVFVIAEDHVPKAVNFLDKMPEDYTIKLDAAVKANGWVVDEQGAPVAGVLVTVRSPGIKPDTSSLLMLHNGAVTVKSQGIEQDHRESVDFQLCRVTNQDDGTWNFNYLPKEMDEVRFILKKPGYVTTDAAVPVAKTGLEKLVLVIDRGFVVTGRIVDAQGRSISGVRIKTVNVDSALRQAVNSDENGVFTIAGVAGDPKKGAYYMTPDVKTNESGRFVVTGLAGTGPMQVELVAQAAGFAGQAREVELREATNVVHFTLLPGNIFHGIVVDEAGNPIGNAIVQTDFDFKNQIDRRFEWTAHTDVNGSFEWNSAPEEEICYWFEAEGYEPVRGMSLSADGSNHKITLKAVAKK